ncbi:MAG: hypothetical protein V4489_09935 [Chlamydiota bacterium]
MINSLQSFDVQGSFNTVDSINSVTIHYRHGGDKILKVPYNNGYDFKNVMNSDSNFKEFISKQSGESGPEDKMAEVFAKALDQSFIQFSFRSGQGYKMDHRYIPPFQGSEEDKVRYFCALKTGKESIEQFSPTCKNQEWFRTLGQHIDMHEEKHNEVVEILTIITPIKGDVNPSERPNLMKNLGAEAVSPVSNRISTPKKTLLPPWTKGLRTIAEEGSVDNPTLRINEANIVKNTKKPEPTPQNGCFEWLFKKKISPDG